MTSMMIPLALPRRNAKPIDMQDIQMQYGVRKLVDGQRQPLALTTTTSGKLSFKWPLRRWTGLVSMRVMWRKVPMVGHLIPVH